jgi:hypothetical protein
MTIKKMVCMLMLANTGITFGMEDNSRATELAKQVAIGSAAGTLEVLVNSPFIYSKNMWQQGLKPSVNPYVWYRGLGMNLAAMGPTTGAQIGADNALEAVIPGTDSMSKVARAFSAGALSAAVNGPVELVIIDQQKNNGGVTATIKKLIAEGGKGVVMRGWIPTALREGAFTTGYLVAFPMLEAAIKSKVDNAAVSYVGAGVATGLVVATATHPVDTIKTRMQADYAKTTIKNMRDAVKMIYAERGVAGFFLGVAPRAIRAGLAIPLIGTIKKKLSKQTDEQN